MAVSLNNEVLDDPLALDACPSFSGGQVSFQRANLLQANQAAGLDNVTILINGELKKRRGIRMLGTGSTGVAEPIRALFWFDSSLLDRLVAFVGDSAYSFDGFEWESFFYTGLSSSEPDMDALQFLDSIYWTDGGAEENGIRKLVDGNPETIEDSPAARILERHGTRLVAAGIAGIPDAVDFSYLLEGDTWDLVNNRIRIGLGDGDPVVGVKSWLDTELLVCKGGSTWLVTASPEQDVAYFPIKLVHSAIGCACRKTIVQVGQDVWWLAPGLGVVSLQKQLATSNNQIATPVSQAVQDVIERISWPHAYRACATFHQNQYFLSIPVESEWPNTVLVFNTITGGWTTFSGWKATAMCSQPFEGQRRLVLGQADGGLKEWLDYQPSGTNAISFSDGGGHFSLPAKLPTRFEYADRGVVSTVLTRAMIFSEPLNPKSGFYVEVEMVKAAGDVAFAAICDGDAPVDLESFSFTADTVSLPIQLPFRLPGAPGWVRKRLPIHHLPPFRELQLKITSRTGNMILRDITVSAFVDTLELHN